MAAPTDPRAVLGVAQTVAPRPGAGQWGLSGQVR